MCKGNEYGHPETEIRTYRMTASGLREKPTPRPMGHDAGSDITECSTNFERLL